MADVLFVSKPVEPPWNDSSKNLVRDLAGAMVRHRPIVMTSRDAPPTALGLAKIEALYSPRDMGHASGLSDQARVLGRLLLGRSGDIVHYFFAPNRRTSSVARGVTWARRRPTIQTVCSAPAVGEHLRQILFADRSVVLSTHTEQRFLAAGVAADRLLLIPPCIPPLPMPSPASQRATRKRHGLDGERPLLVYPGDLEFSKGADRCLEVLADLPKEPGATLAVCARFKTPAARNRLAELRATAKRLKVEGRVRFLGEISDIHDVLATADVVLLPAENLYAKMDLPLVLLDVSSIGASKHQTIVVS